MLQAEKRRLKAEKQLQNFQVWQTASCGTELQEANKRNILMHKAPRYGPFLVKPRSPQTPGEAVKPRSPQPPGEGVKG